MSFPIEVNSNIVGASVSRTRRKLGYETRYDFRAGQRTISKCTGNPETLRGEREKCEIDQTASLRLKTSGEINTMAATSISIREIGRAKKIKKLPLDIIND